MADLELGLSVEGVDEAVRDLERVKDSQAQVGRAAVQSSQVTTSAARQSAQAMRTASQSAQSFGASATQMIQRMGGAASAVQGLTGALGVGGRTAGLVGALANAVAQGSAFGAQFGPQGAVVGGLVGAFLPALGRVVELTNRATRSASEMAAAYQAAGQQMRTAMLEARRAGDVAAGVFGSDTSDEQLAQTVQTLIARISGGGDEEGIDRQISRLARSAQRDGIREEDTTLPQLRAERAELERQRVAAEAEIERRRQQRAGTESSGVVVPGATAVSPEGSPAARSASRAGGGQDPGERLAAQMAYFRAIQDGWRQLEEEEKAHLDRLGESERAHDEEKRQRALEGVEIQREAAREIARIEVEKTEQMRELAEEQHQAALRFSDGYVSSIDQVMASWRSLEQATKNARGTMLSQGRLMERGMTAIGNNIAEVVGGAMVNAFEQAVTAWVSGAKTFEEAAESMVKTVIQSLVIESIVQGVVELARGVADAASQRWDSAALHFAAAAAWAAVGAVAGVVGGAIGAFGGGGGERRSQGSDNREMARESVQERDVSQPIVINVYPEIFAGREAQRFVYDAINTGSGSHQIDPRAIRGVGR